MNVGELMNWLKDLDPSMNVYLTPNLEDYWELKEPYLGVYNEVLLSGITNEEYDAKKEARKI